MPVAEGESQESVLHRALEAAADRAGLSTEPDGGSKKKFVDDLLKANTSADGTISINNTGKTPAEKYQPEDWSKLGGLNFRLTDKQVNFLKELKSADNFSAGTKAADDILRALELGERGFFDKLTSKTDASIELAKALNTVKANGGGYDFQQGLLSRLGADKTVQLEKMLNGNGQYNSIVKDALATTGLARPDKQDRTADLRREIGEKSSLDALVRLTGDKSYPMDKNFLVGAGKKVTTEGVGWIQSKAKPGQFLSYDTISARSETIFAAIGKSPEASAELLNNVDFVKNGLRMSNMTPMESTTKIRNFDQIITAGTSAEAREKNPEKVEKAIITLAETIGNADSYRPQDLGRISGDVLGMPREKVVSEQTANALAKAVQENPQIFFSAAQSDEVEKDRLDKKDVLNVFTAISQYENPKRNLEASVSSQVAKLMNEGASFTNKKTEKPVEIGLLLDTFVRADKNASLKNASNEDKKIEMAMNLFNDVAGLVPFGDMPMQSLTKLAMATSQKRITELAKTGTKGTYVDIEKGNLEDKESKLNVLISRSTLKAYEQSAYTTLKDKNASPDAKSEAGKFLENIKIYNEAMPANERILDANGKLVDPNAPTTNGGQRINMNRLAQGGINYNNKPQAEEASRNVGNLVRPTATEIKNEIKGAYKP